VQVDPAALELELVDLALAVVVAAGLEGEHLQVARQVLEVGEQFSYRHPLSVACQALYVVSTWAPTGWISPTGNRAERACAVCAPAVEPRCARSARPSPAPRRGYCSSTEMTRAVSFTPDERVEALSSCEISYSSPVMVKLLV
jgi:hypothetical protein